MLRRQNETDYHEVLMVLRECGVASGYLEASHMENFLVARSGRCIVGVVGMILQGTVAVGHSLAVVPGFRGMGLGRRLANSLFDWMGSLGIGSVYLFTCQAEFYFRAMGFSVVSQEEVPDPVLQSLYELCEPRVVGGGHVLHFPLDQAIERVAAGAEGYSSKGPLVSVLT
jgi:N-acetylglutamate synthase-like GNAT family acetyltransferase